MVVGALVVADLNAETLETCVFAQESRSPPVL